MINSFCVALLVLINAFVHLTHANSYHQSYERNTGQGHQDSDGSYVTNFGNGENKRNFVKIEDRFDGSSISGTSFTNDETGKPSIQKINVDVKNPNYRGGAQGPDVHWNPKSTRTQVTNIGNGVGNKNVFVINDDRHDQSTPRSNQDGYQGRTRHITNIGRGPDNDNQIYVNNKRVYPNAGRRTYSYKMRNPHFKRILRKNVRDVVRNPLAIQNRRRDWRRSLRNMLHRRHA